MIYKRVLLFALPIILLFNFCEKSPTASQNQDSNIAVKDIDGNEYKTVKIGDQEWMVDNLKVTHYRNGEPIPNVTDNTEWSNLSTGAYCSYENNDSNINKYGLLYNWYAVDDNRNIAPEGWHIPTDDDWKQLEMYLGMSQSEANIDEDWRGTDEGGKLKEAGTAQWLSPNTGATNSSGFSAIPGGVRDYEDGTFRDMGYGAAFWSTIDTKVRGLYYEHSDVSRGPADKRYGFSLRCLKD